MVERVRPLIEVLREVREARKRRGIRDAQAALLALACAALLCGRTRYGQIAAWGRSYQVLNALGFTHPTLPCEVTFYHLVRKLDVAAFERVLAAWAAPILAVTGTTVFASPRLLRPAMAAPRRARQRPWAQ